MFVGAAALFLGDVVEFLDEISFKKKKGDQGYKVKDNHPENEDVEAKKIGLDDDLPFISG